MLLDSEYKESAARAHRHECADSSVLARWGETERCRVGPSAQPVRGVTPRRSLCRGLAIQAKWLCQSRLGWVSWSLASASLKQGEGDGGPEAGRSPGHRRR